MSFRTPRPTGISGTTAWLPGSFQGRIDLTQVGSTHIFRERWSRKFRYRGLTPCDTYAFALPIAQPGPFNWVGAAGCLDTVFIQAPGKEADLVSSEYLDALILAISKEQVHSTVAALSDMDHLFDERHATIKLAPERAAHLRQLGKAILAPAMQESASDPIETKFWSEQLVKLYLWEVVRTCERFSPVAAPARSAILVQSATELVLSGPAGGIGLTEICAEFGVSLRTLHYAFQDVTGCPRRPGCAGSGSIGSTRRYCRGHPRKPRSRALQ